MDHSHICPSVQLYICDTSSLGIILTQIAKDTGVEILYVHAHTFINTWKRDILVAAYLTF